MAAKKNGKSVETAFEAPKGYRKVEMRINGFWKPESVGDWIEGVVGERVEQRGSDGKPNVFYTFRLADDDSVQGAIKKKDDAGNEVMVKPEGGMLLGLSGRTLMPFLNDRVGQAVFLRYIGLGKAKPGQSAPKMYETFEKEE